MSLALAGIDTLFLVSATEHPDRVGVHAGFVDAAAQAGVRHIVHTSFYAAAPQATFTHARDHWHTEQHIRSGGIGFTFLRDNLYADFVPLLADEHGVIRGPAGSGKVSVVALDDVADVASIVLREVLSGSSVHNGRTYDLTGPQPRATTPPIPTLSATLHPAGVGVKTVLG